MDCWEPNDIKISVDRKLFYGDDSSEVNRMFANYLNISVIRKRSFRDISPKCLLYEYKATSLLNWFTI